MRKFFSYGPLDTEEHYYAPRKELLEDIYHHLIGDNPQKGGHYFTVWAPRQTGKTWCLNQLCHRLSRENTFDVMMISLDDFRDQTDVGQITNALAQLILKKLGKETKDTYTLLDFGAIFSRDNLKRPLILVLDEFDALREEAINALVAVFRKIYNARQRQTTANNGKNRRKRLFAPWTGPHRGSASSGDRKQIRFAV